jgi:hypothetical protein
MINSSWTFLLDKFITFNVVRIEPVRYLEALSSVSETLKVNKSKHFSNL